MSSRLFQEIREKRGWAYAVYSYGSFFMTTGLFTSYMGLSYDHLQGSLDVVDTILTDCQTSLCSSSEFDRIKEQLKGNLLLSLEKSMSWMSWHAKQQLYRGTILSVEEVTSAIDAVTKEQLQSCAQAYLSPEHMCLSMIGPFGDAALAADGISYSDFKANSTTFLPRQVVSK